MHSIRMKKTLTFLITGTLGLAFGFISPVSSAADRRIPTLLELRLLPPYCANTQIISTSYGRQQAPGKYDASTKPYVDVYGEDFWHLHHYCFGLTQANRAYTERSRGQREARWRESVGEIDYVIRSAKSDFILLPELRTAKAASLLKLKRNAEAVLELQKAIAQDATYARAFAVLSDYYRDARNKGLALQTLEQGLTASPDERSLQRRYAELGGTKKFVAPPSPPEVIAEPEESQPETSGTAGENETALPPVEIQPYKQGNDTNPYCRFCP